MLTTLLDLVAIACFAVLAWLVWPPLLLAVAGCVALAMSRRRS